MSRSVCWYIDTGAAFGFAARVHNGQRYGGYPYTEHLRQVHEVVMSVTDHLPTQIAAILHDAVEDGKVTWEATLRSVDRADIVMRFGEDIAGLVMENTDDPTLSKKDQKAAQLRSMPAKSRGAKIIKLADAYCNAKSLMRGAPPGWRPDSTRAYALSRRALHEAVRGHAPALDEMWDEMWPQLAETLGIA